MDVVKEQELRDAYYDPVEGYQSVEKLYQKLKGKGITRKDVKHWLETQSTYTRYKPKRKLHRYLKTFVGHLADQAQLDLVDMQNYYIENNGYRWILTSVEILSRYAFAVPVHRKNTKSMTKAVETFLDDFHERFGKYPNVVQV